MLGRRSWYRRPTAEQLLSALYQLNVPDEWKGILLSCGLSEEDIKQPLTGGVKSAQGMLAKIFLIAVTLLEVAHHAIEWKSSKKSLPSLVEIVKSKHELNTIKPGQLNTLQDLRESEVTQLKTLLKETLSTRREFIETTKSEKLPSVQASILWTV